MQVNVQLHDFGFACETRVGAYTLFVSSTRPPISESESEMFLFDLYQKYIQSNNETILDQGTPTKTSLVANIRAAYYIINNYFFIS